MNKWLKKHLKNEKGLTLVELLAVIVILGIIAAIAVPAIGGIINNSKVGALKADVLNAISAAELYLVESPDSESGSVTLDNLLGTGEGATNEAYLSDKGNLESFEYNVENKTAKFTAKNGDISISSEGATKKQVNDLPNNSKTGTEVISVSR